MSWFRQCSMLAVVIISVISFSSCAERRFDEAGDQGNRYDQSGHFDKKFTVAPGGVLRIRTDVGSVSIRGGEGTTVSVVAEVQGRSRDVERFQITADQNGNAVEVIGKAHGKGGWFNNSMNLDARFEITVPKDFNVEVFTSGGNVDVTSLKGTIRGGTSGGDIRVETVEGGVDLKTSGGTVEARSVTGKLHMSTSGGDVRVSAIVGDVDLGTSGGNVEVEGVDGAVAANTSGGNVRIRLTGANKGIHAETSGGNIDLAIAGSSAANIDLSTSGGDVTCDMPVTVQGRIKEDNVRGTLNGGGPTIYGHTSGGNVTLRPL